MVLEVLSDSRKMLHDGNAEAVLFLLITDTGLQQYLRRMDRAQR